MLLRSRSHTKHSFQFETDSHRRPIMVMRLTVGCAARR